MSQSLVPVLTPGVQGPGQGPGPGQGQPLHQKTPGSLMVYTPLYIYTLTVVVEKHLCIEFVFLCVVSALHLQLAGL